jgi:formylmethanofuran dehydrogenase subunit E-like metal-binding protein
MFLPKNAISGVRLNLKPSDLDKPNWLRNYLDKLEKENPNSSRVTATTEMDLDIEESELFDEADENERNVFSRELKSAMGANGQQIKLSNYGQNAKVVNTSSSRACLIS